MIALTPDQLTAIAATGNLAPSVHNTQPTRWRWGEDGALWLLADMSRRLTVGDPQSRDLQVSVGAALEATAMALAAAGIGIGKLDYPAPRTGALVPLARAELETAPVAPLAPAVRARMTWRKGFAEAPAEKARALANWVEQQDDLVPLSDRTELETVATLNERASLAFYRNAPYRAELLSWMRLKRTDPRHGIDGLSAEALGMSRVEAMGAGLALRQPLFGVLDALGLFAGLVSEAARTKGSTAVLLFHRPADENPIDTGRILYGRLLALAALGFQTWPMAVLADDPATAAELSGRYAIAQDRRLITAWRVGLPPADAKVVRERLPPASLIV
jgi:hypothetical protein